MKQKRNNFPEQKHQIVGKKYSIFPVKIYHRRCNESSTNSVLNLPLFCQTIYRKVLDYFITNRLQWKQYVLTERTDTISRLDETVVKHEERPAEKVFVVNEPESLLNERRRTNFFDRDTFISWHLNLTWNELTKSMEKQLGWKKRGRRTANESNGESDVASEIWAVENRIHVKRREFLFFRWTRP